MGREDAAALREYHDATKHSLTSLRRDRHGLDWPSMPRPFKVYPDLAAIPLPRDFETSIRPALASIAGAGGSAAARLDLATLARLLYFSAGVLRRRTYPGGEIYFRAAACTGALYHIDLYVVTGAVPGLEAGVYHFGPHDFALRRLRAGDHRAVVAEATGEEPSVVGAPALLALTTTFWRNAWKYRARAYRHAFWDAGTIVANLLAVASGVGVPARVALGFVDATLDRLLDLDRQREVTIALASLGCGSTGAGPVPPAEPLALATLPPPAGEVDYPSIRSAHAAAALAVPAEVVEWRVAERIADAVAPAAEGTPLPPLVPGAAREPVEQVIARRGSSRRFRREPISLLDLGTVLSAATRGLAADVAVTPTLYVIVNAVDGLAPGSYVHDRHRDALGLLRAGDFRREAAHLGLGQDLAGDAAVDLFWLVDLAAVFDRLGGRGYRAAQLAAAIEGGRSYLAAYALGLGATGLTFFDDDVTTFFSPHAAGKSVLFLVALGVCRPPKGERR